jgi:hypothetical protein
MQICKFKVHEASVTVPGMFWLEYVMMSFYILSQCTSGMYSAQWSASCTPCGRGKYLINSQGETEPLSCMAVSIASHVMPEQD